MELQWAHMMELILSDTKRFKKIIDGWENLFKRMYSLVCTRCYGYYLPYTFMAPIADMVNHDHNNDTGLILVNKELHVDPLKSKSYFKSGKYLNDVRIIYNTDSEADQKAKADVLSHGYHVSEEYWRQRKEATLPGWQDQIEQEGAQAWKLIYNTKEVDYTPTGTYEDLDYSDEEEEADGDEDEETKEARDGIRNTIKVPRVKQATVAAETTPAIPEAAEEEEEKKEEEEAEEEEEEEEKKEE